MAVGKNKRLSKGKKGGKKKASDPFARKDLYTIKAPTVFATRKCGKTLITRTTGTSKLSLSRTYVNSEDVIVSNVQTSNIICSRRNRLRGLERTCVRAFPR